MEVKVAETAGFCFGVKRAVKTVYEQAESGVKPIYTFGPIIHNEQVVEDLESKGVVVIHDEQELKTIRKGTVIIRSHGVEKRIYEQVESQNLQLVDATCPFVKKIHKIVFERTGKGEDVIVIGSPDHPEVQGICGWRQEPGQVFVIENEAQAENFEPRNGVSLSVVSQTTFNYKKFNKIVAILDKMIYDKNNILNTICSATEERQTEARQLASECDAMIVIGGKHSSNTQKLFEICKGECLNTYYIQTLVDLDIRLLPSRGCVGITAGASTPNKLIEEVSKQCQK